MTSGSPTEPADASRPSKTHRRTVLVCGATGFIGKALVARLCAGGDRVLALVRDAPAARRRLPDGVTLLTDAGAIGREERIDAVVNLAGAPVIAGRWSARRRAALLESRLGPNRSLLDVMARLDVRPSVFVSASAVGFYGDRGEERLDETAPAGSGFMADLCRIWEAEAVGAEALGIRTCLLRLGMVFGPGGGPLPPLLLPAGLGLGAVLGGGRQWAPWVGLDDAVAVIVAALGDDRYAGPINVVSPRPVTQAAMTDAFARLLGRPRWVSIPAWPLRLALGEMSDLFLASQKVAPAKLQALGFDWRSPELADVVVARPEDPGRAARKSPGVSTGA